MRTAAVCCLIITSAVSGCRAPQRLEVSDAGSPLFDRFHAEYRFDQPGELLGRAFSTESGSATRQGVKPVSWNSGWSDAELTITCPHPDRDASVAQVILSLTSDATSTAGPKKVTRMLTVPRSSVELLIADLAESDFFSASQPSDAGLDSAASVSLDVEIDRGRTNRLWHSEPRLLDLAHRTLTEGR